MKYTIRKTGEIVDVIGYSCIGTSRDEVDTVSYIDSKGNEVVAKGLNIYLDFIPYEEEVWIKYRRDLAASIISNNLTMGSLEEVGTWQIKKAITIADWFTKFMREFEFNEQKINIEQKQETDVKSDTQDN